MDIRNFENEIQVPFVSDAIREELYSWLCKVNSEYFKDSNHIYELSIEICERYFMSCSFMMENYKSIICAGCTALWIAHKLESHDDTQHPLEDYIYLSSESFTKNELIEMERKICYALEYYLYNPLAFGF